MSCFEQTANSVVKQVRSERGLRDKRSSQILVTLTSKAQTTLYVRTAINMQRKGLVVTDATTGNITNVGKKVKSQRY